MSHRIHYTILVFGALGFLLQLVDTWPILAATRGTTLISAAVLHTVAVGSVVSVILKLRRNESVLPADVLGLAFVMLLTWSADLRLIMVISR